MDSSLDATTASRNSTIAAGNGHSNGHHPEVLSSARPSKPDVLKVLSDAIPDELKQLDNWVGS